MSTLQAPKSNGSNGGGGEMQTSFSSHSLSKEHVGRFSRQLILQGFGPGAQERLRDSAALIVGAGGLGCPVAIYLAGAGVGRIGIVDHDTVSLENLHRQVAHSEGKVGAPKVDSLKESIHRLNSETKVDTFEALLSEQNAFAIAEGFDVVVDCSDNVATRYLVNDTCILLKKPLVSGSALGWEGQLTVYNNGPKCPCYRCIFPVPPNPETVTNCSDGGVLGPVVGVIGSMQALEVIKIIIRGKSSFAGNLWLFDGLDGYSRTISLREKMPTCAVCGPSPTVTSLTNYKQFCGAGPTDKICSISLIPPEERISVSAYKVERQKCSSGPPLLLLDARPAREFDICHLPEAKNIPLDELKKLDLGAVVKRLGGGGGGHGARAATATTNTMYVVCHRGNDSQRAVDLLRSKAAGSANYASSHFRFIDIIGGLEQWAIEVDSAFPRY